MSSKIDIRPDHLEIVQNILHAHLPPNVKVWVFGSRATWKAKDYSDLDLLLEGEEMLPRDVMIEIECAFEESDLPWKVDVLDVHNTTPAFLQAIERDKVAFTLKKKEGGLGEWKTRTLRDVAEINMGQSPKSNFYNKDNIGLPFLQGNRTFGSKFPTFDTYCSEPQKIAKKGEVLFSVRAPVGDINFAHTDICIGRGLASFKAFEDEVFLFYLLHHTKQRIIQSETGSVFGSVSKGILESIEIQLPPIAEQKAIGEMLSSLDDKIENNRRINKTLEEMAQAIFKSWFVDFDPVHAKVRALKKGGGEEGARLAAMCAISGQSTDDLARLKSQDPESYSTLSTTADAFPSSFIDSELGNIPEGWQTSNAEDLFDISIGKTPPRKEAQWFSKDPKNIEWLSIRDMGSGTLFTPKTSETLTTEAVNKHNVKIIPKDTVLLSFKLTLGRVQIASKEICTNEAIAHFKKTDKSPDFTWTYSYLKGFDYSRLGNTSSIATAVNSQTIKKMPILRISTELEGLFSNAVISIFDKIKLNEQENQSLTKTRDVLLPKLLSGEIDVLGVDGE